MFTLARNHALHSFSFSMRHSTTYLWFFAYHFHHSFCIPLFALRCVFIIADKLVVCAIPHINTQLNGILSVSVEKRLSEFDDGMVDLHPLFLWPMFDSIVIFGLFCFYFSFIFHSFIQFHFFFFLHSFERFMQEKEEKQANPMNSSKDEIKRKKVNNSIIMVMICMLHWAFEVESDAWNDTTNSLESPNNRIK